MAFDQPHLGGAYRERQGRLRSERMVMTNCRWLAALVWFSSPARWAITPRQTVTYYQVMPLYRLIGAR
jgi:hypothetical protein